MNQLVADMLELARPDIDMVVREELEKLPPCEGATHSRGLFGHQVEQPASYLVSVPCGDAWLACDGWVATLPFYTRLECECGTWHPSEEIRYTPLDLGMA